MGVRVTGNNEYEPRFSSSAYDGELRFFDSKDGLRNVPLKKKKKRPVV